MPPNRYFYIFSDINMDWLPPVLCNEIIWKSALDLEKFLSFLNFH